MSRFSTVIRGPEPWVFAASQAAAMLGFNVLLRVAVL